MSGDNGNFDFLKEYLGDSQKDVPFTLGKAYEICEKNNFWAFFRDCPPPSQHNYLWWHPRNINFSQWENVYKVFKPELVNKYHLDSHMMNYHMEILALIAIEEWEDAKKVILTKYVP